MKFYSNNEYKNAIKCTTEELKELEAKGWTVNMHTPGYTNFIGVKSSGISIGFYNWMHNLGFGIIGEDDYENEYSSIYEADIKIESQEDLDNLCAMIDLFAKLKK